MCDALCNFVTRRSHKQLQYRNYQPTLRQIESLMLYVEESFRQPKNHWCGMYVGTDSVIEDP